MSGVRGIRMIPGRRVQPGVVAVVRRAQEVVVEPELAHVDEAARRGRGHAARRIGVVVEIGDTRVGVRGADHDLRAVGAQQVDQAAQMAGEVRGGRGARGVGGHLAEAEHDDVEVGRGRPAGGGEVAEPADAAQHGVAGHAGVDDVDRRPGTLGLHWRRRPAGDGRVEGGAIARRVIARHPGSRKGRGDAGGQACHPAAADRARGVIAHRHAIADAADRHSAAREQPGQRAWDRRAQPAFVAPQGQPGRPDRHVVAPQCERGAARRCVLNQHVVVVGWQAAQAEAARRVGRGCRRGSEPRHARRQHADPEARHGIQRDRGARHRSARPIFHHIAINALHNSHQFSAFSYQRAAISGQPWPAPS